MLFFFFYTIRFPTKIVSKSLLKLEKIIWKFLVWDTFKKKINWVQPEYLTWVTFVTERNLIDITLSQVGKLPSGLQVYPSWLYNSLKISNYIKKKKAKVYVPRVKCQLFLGNLCLFYMFQILKSIIHKNYDHKPFHGSQPCPG